MVGHTPSQLPGINSLYIMYCSCRDAELWFCDVQDPKDTLEVLEDIYDALEMLRESGLLTHAFVYSLASIATAGLEEVEVCADQFLLSAANFT